MKLLIFILFSIHLFLRKLILSMERFMWYRKFFLELMIDAWVNLRQRVIIILVMLVYCFCFQSQAQINHNHITTTGIDSIAYDPFGPEHAPDYIGQGSGGVLTPSPYDNTMQTYFTRMNADYYGIQYMLDSPLQLAIGTGWSAYQTNEFGIMIKARSSGIKKWKFDPSQEENVPYYLFSIEASAERNLHDNKSQAFKIRVNILAEPKGLHMSGIGLLLSKWNFLLASNRQMDRKLEAEATWIQIEGGYIMPLSPKKGGVNIAICGGVDLLGVKYQSYYSDQGNFLGLKIGTIGWLGGVGWNTNDLVNLMVYVGGDWSFTTGGLKMSTGKIFGADIARNTLQAGIQATSHWFNVTAGIQKEWESLDYLKTVISNKGLNYYFGFNA